MGKATLLRDIAAKIAEKGKPFYSAAEKAAQELPRTKGTGAEFMRELEKTKGVKPAEIQHRKLDEIKSMPKMTKEEFVKEVQARPPAQVEEKIIRDPSEQDYKDLARRMMDEDATEYVNNTIGIRTPRKSEQWDDLFYEELGRLERYRSKEYLERAYQQPESFDLDILTRYNDPKYLLPGGENYREMLLKLPERGLNKKEATDKMVFESMARRGELSPEQQARLDELTQKQQSMGENYQSAHWKGEPNVLAHMRVSDRVGPNGEKVLHVEEIQSDWHQAGRKKGYKETPNTEGWSVKSPNPYEPNEVIVYDQNGKAVWTGTNRFGTDRQIIENVSGKLQEDKVPDAPFKKNWQELAMNRLLSYAAENGYDRVALTPGAEQAERYNLSKYIDTLTYHPEKKRLVAFDKNLNKVLERNGVEQNQIDDFVGKDVAKKLIESPIAKSTGHHSITGQDLKIGGEGMQGFYDKMLPDYLNKLGKKYGVEVERESFPLSYEVDKAKAQADDQLLEQLGVEIPTANQIKLHSFQITPEMRKDITEQGFPLYSAVAAPVGLGAVQQDVLPKVGITDNEDAMKLDLMDQELREPEQNFDKGGAAFGVFPQMKGKRSKQDREAAKNVPVDLLRGAVSGVLGAPGDIESLIRLLPGLNEETVLPTSEDIEKRLPFQSDTPVSRAATGLGQLAGGFYTGPGSPLKAIAGVPKAIKHGAEEFAKASAMGVPRLDVWHGSPHKFQPTAKNPLGEFDPSKIGTGEGAQAYGHGHYTSEAKEVGKGYQPRSPEYEEKLLKLYDRAQSSGNYPMMEVLEDAMLHSDPEDILKRFTGVDSGYTPAHAKAAQDFAKWYVKNPPEVGSLYRVDLADEVIPKMLDWNAKFENQHPDVQAAILKYWADNPSMRHYGDPTKMTGEGIYGSARAASLGPEGGAKANLNPSNEAASMDLRHYGIPGIKYLDESHRTSSRVPEGVTNYVVFPGGEDLLNIVERKAEGGEVGMSEGGKPKYPTPEMREKLRQLRESFMPAANEAERQKRMQQNMEQTNRKVSFSDDPETMQAEIHAAGGGLLKKAAKLLKSGDEMLSHIVKTDPAKEALKNDKMVDYIKSRKFSEKTIDPSKLPSFDEINAIESDPYNRVLMPDEYKVRDYKARIESGSMPPPIVMDEHGNILDGQHRAIAAREAGVPIKAYVPEKKFGAGGEIKASPRDEAWGTAADIAKALEEASKKQFGYSNPATEKIAELFGLPGLARTLERKAYGQPITNIGKANVGVLPDDTVDALLAVAPLGKPIAKGAKAAAKAAAGEVEKAMFGESSSKLLNELTPQVMSAYKPHTPLKPDPEVGTRYKVTDTGGLAPRKDLNIEDLQNSQVKIFPWDATSRNKLVTEVSDVPLTKPVLTEGGDDYMRDLKHIEQGIAGASNRGMANRIMGRINQAAVENQLLGGGTGRVFGFPIRMAEKAEYAATFPTDVALDLLKQAGLKKKELKALDENMRNMVFDGERGAFKDMAPFGSPEFEYQLRHGLKSDKKKDIKGFTDMNLRKAFMDRMSMVENQKRMGYNIQDLTGSVLAEELKGVPKGYVGNVAAELEPYGKLRPSKSSTYDTDFPGLYVGSMPNMPVEFLMPRTFENIYREMKALYPYKTQEALRNMTIGAMEKRNKGISEKIEQRAVDATKTYQEGLMKGEFDPNDLTQVYDYMRRKKLELKLAKGGSTGLIEVKKRKAKA